MDDSGKCLIIVGTNTRNQELLADFIRRLGYKVERADSLDQLDTMLTSPLAPSFALVDITGFDRGIWERCTTLNKRNIPVLIISPRQSAEVTSLSLAHGAQSVLTKPLVMQELANVINGAMSSG